MDVREQRLATLAGLVRAREVSAREVVSAALAAIDATNPTINAFVAVDADRALDDARALDERIARGDDPGPLAGVPLGVKDTEDAVGYRTTFGSALWADAPEAEGDSILVQRLKAAGCIVVGKTNTPELASKATTDNPTFGVTRNPLARDHTSGGSSGGSAAAVAAGLVPLATGSDGGGSIRIPSSCCGLTGFKPSLGRVPDGGPRPVDWHDLTTRGVLARTAADLVAAYDVVVGPHPSDLRSLPAPSVPWSEALATATGPTRLAWSPTLGYASVDPEVLAACAHAVGRLAEAGVEVVDVPDVFGDDPVMAWATLVAVYNERTLAAAADRFDRLERLDPDLTFYRQVAEQATALDMVEAEDRCHDLNLRLLEVFERVDLLACPTVAGLPPAIGEPDPTWVQLTYPFNMTRSPAGTVPVGFSSAGLPIGLQLVGPQHADVAVLAALQWVEERLVEV